MLGWAKKEEERRERGRKGGSSGGWSLWSEVRSEVFDESYPHKTGSVSACVTVYK